jgi:glycosyltransferase involved in cell wall biosynthesis
MKVVLFTSSFLPVVGGMEYVVHYLAEALLDEGVDVTVMARRQMKQDNFQHRYRLIRYGLPVRGGHRLRIDHASACWELFRLDRNPRIDVAHIHCVDGPPQLSLRYFKARGIPVVMTPHGEDVQRVPEIGYGARLQPKWDRIIQRHLRAADAVTAISNSISNELTNVEGHRLFKVPNGIHVKVFGRSRTTYLQEKLDLDPDTRIILSVGRNHIKKGYEFGIRAMAELVGRYGVRGWHYVLVGRGVSALAPVVRQLDIGNSVSLVEVLPPDQLSLCYNSSHLFFSPSIVEGLSLVSIEAMACGLPLVVTDVPGNEDIVSENQCGLIVRNKDVQDMARGLNELIQDEKQRQLFGDLALERSARYDWREIARKYIEVYETVISRRRMEAVP